MFSDPEKNVGSFGLIEGMRVADFGAGSGVYTLALARRVGDRGRVYAIDVQKNLLDRLLGQAKSERLGNVEIVWGDVEKRGGSTLADGTVDAVVLANVLFLSDARYSIFLEAKRILHPGGLLVVVDWTDSFGGLGPAPDRIILPEEVKRIAAEAGFSFSREVTAGEHHYGLIFTV